MTNGDDMISEGGPVQEAIIAVRFTQAEELTIRFTESQYEEIINNQDDEDIQETLDVYLSDMNQLDLTWEIIPDTGSGYTYRD